MPIPLKRATHDHPSSTNPMTSPIARNDWLKFAPTPPALGPNFTWHVFLSYRSVNRVWVVNLYDVLREHGFEVFLDQAKIVAGNQLIETLEEALTKSRAGVLVWSTAASDSTWVKREYQVMETRADDGEFAFVPIRLNAVALPPFASLRVFLDFAQYPDGPNGGELLRLLYAICGEQMPDDAVRFATEQDDAARRFSAQLKAAVHNGAAGTIKKLFDAGGLAWETSSALGCTAAEGLTKLGKYDEALVVLQEVVQRFPRAIRPRQLQALALARRGGEGDLEDAQAILGELYEMGERDPETAGIYARTWMDRYRASGNALDLRHARDLYASAFDAAPDDYYTGINAASKSALLGTDADLAAATGYATRVQQIVGDKPVPNDYWKTATVAETALLLGQFSAAATCYAAAVATAPNEIGSHKSTWGQAALLLDALNASDADRAQVRSAFSHLQDGG
jgi:tetratricopeptide (TPR) repeat protein